MIPLAGLVMGTNDLSKETRARIVPGRAPMRSWLMTCVAAARAYGLDILDGVYNDITDAEGFERECLEARDLGFDGKTLIHPSQIEPCNRVFSPTPAELDEARKILAAFALPENRGKGVIIGKGCQHHVAAGEIGELCDGLGAGQCRCALKLAVIGQHLVAVIDEIGGESVPHMPETDHTDALDNEPGSLLAL